MPGRVDMPDNTRSLKVGDDNAPVGVQRLHVSIAVGVPSPVAEARSELFLDDREIFDLLISGRQNLSPRIPPQHYSY
ncbi:MAG: hypothetical protein MUP70_02160 [Candidatus Aminicenantes bacterium]|nr:hypothetical protein [Candidatus Aminicenantes bacterium]